MKAADLREMSAKELNEKLVELKQELFTFASSTPSTNWTTPAASQR